MKKLSRNQIINNLRSHLIHPSENYPDELLFGVTSKDSICLGEHLIMGSTAVYVDYPWVPYALLADPSRIDEINQDRQRRENNGFPAVACDFILPANYRLLISLDPANKDTLQVPLPRILNVFYLENDSPVPQNLWKGKEYRGMYYNIEQIIMKKRKI